MTPRRVSVPPQMTSHRVSPSSLLRFSAAPSRRSKRPPRRLAGWNAVAASAAACWVFIKVHQKAESLERCSCAPTTPTTRRRLSRPDDFGGRPIRLHDELPRRVRTPSPGERRVPSAAPPLASRRGANRTVSRVDCRRRGSTPSAHAAPSSDHASGPPHAEPPPPHRPPGLHLQSLSHRGEEPARTPRTRPTGTTSRTGTSPPGRRRPRRPRRPRKLPDRARTCARR